MKQIAIRLSVLLLILGCAIFAFAQSDSARLTGTVVDPQGAVVSNATITLTNLGTGRVQTVQSGSTGEYTLNALPPGQYKLEVKAPSFKSITQTITLQTAQVAAANFTMQAGAVTENVEVKVDIPLVETANSNISEVVVGRQVTELPLNGRNFTQLATLVPGVTRGVQNGHVSGASGDAETFRYGDTGGAALSVNGLRAQANSFLLDGIDNNESLVNTVVFFPPAEAIQEFRVDTSVAPAEFGRAGGAVVNTSFKSGTNTWHGSAFEFLRNSALDARPFFNKKYDANGKEIPKPTFRRNQFGGTLGGALIKDKLFVFGDYQGLRQFKPMNIDRTSVPTDLMRQGNFSELLNPSIMGANVIQLRDPATGLPIPGNIITNPNPAGLAYLKAFPKANCSSATSSVCGILTNNYESQRQQIQSFNDFDIRVDYILRSQDSLFGRFSYGKDHSVTTSQLPALPAGWGSGDNINWPRSIVLGETHTLSTSMINEFRFGFVRTKYGYEPPFASEAISQNLGIANANTSSLLGGGALIGANDISWTGDYGPYLVPQNSFQYSDTLSIVRKNHNIKLGGNVVRRQVNLFRPKFGKGEFIFDGSSTGYDAADMLAGFASHYEVGPALGMSGTRNWEMGYFFQDDWKVNRRLSLNFGLRYDLFTWPVEVHDWQANFNIATGKMEIAGQNGNSRSFIPTDKNNFAPRIGFAYDLTGDGKTVLRGGYGMFYFPDRGGIDNQLAQNAPFSGSAGWDFGALTPPPGGFSASSGYRFTFTGMGPKGDNNPAHATGPLPGKGVLDLSTITPTAFAALPTNRTSYVQEWNAQIQRELSSNTVARIAYVGTKGSNLIRYYDMNKQKYDAASGVRQNWTNVTDVYVQDASASSDYHSLQAQLEKRLSNGLQLIGSYTWSHTIDNAPDAYDGSRDIPDYLNLALERGNSSFDVRHRFVLSSLYELPFGKGKTLGHSWSGPVQAFLGGWQANGILTLQSGQPFDITLDWDGNPNHLRPDLVKSTVAQPHSVETCWFDPTAFAPPPSVGGVFTRPGNLPRNFLTGPGTHTLDFSLFKNFNITERFKTEFRTEFYNLTNTPQFANPEANRAGWQGNFGKITNTRFASERQIQFALRISF